MGQSRQDMIPVTDIEWPNKRAARKGRVPRGSPMTSPKALPAVFVSMVLIACGSAILQAADPDEWKAVATISGNDSITQIHVRNLLLSNGITSFVEGSLAYAIEVPGSNAVQAARLLRDDAQGRTYNISFGSNGVVRAPEPKLLLSDVAISSALQRPEYVSETALGRFLRTKEVSDLTAKYPNIVALMVRERPYLATTNKIDTAYEVDIKLSKARGDRAFGYRGGYQVYGGGTNVVRQGANEAR